MSDDRGVTNIGTSVEQPDKQRLLSRVWAVLHMSLTRAQTIVGLLAGLLSITGTVFSVPSIFKPAPVPPPGEVVTFVQEAKSQKGVPDAKIEILTVQNALVATLKPDSQGRVRQALREGMYRVRVSHPRFVAEVRQIQVVSGQTIHLRMRLRSNSSAPLESAGRAIKRLFGFESRSSP